MDRRRFLRQLTTYGLGIYGLAKLGTDFAQPSQQIDIAYAKGADIAVVLQKVINALGGIKKFVKPKNKVVIKPNFSWSREPEVAATNNPQLIKELVKLCQQAGASEVKVLDHTIDHPEICLDRTKIRDTLKGTGGKVLAINGREYYKGIKIAKAKILKSVEVAKDVLNADVFINVPIAKVHVTTGVVMGMKNLMGVVWDRGYFHKSGLEQCIADLSLAIKPDLIILDAIRMLTTNGPKGPGDTKKLNLIAAGLDPVAMDAFGTQLLGKKAETIAHIKAASKLGIGQLNLKKIKVKQIK